MTPFLFFQYVIAGVLGVAAALAVLLAVLFAVFFLSESLKTIRRKRADAEVRRKLELRVVSQRNSRVQ